VPPLSIPLDRFETFRDYSIEYTATSGVPVQK
jgi:hypothetical protein